MVNLTIHKSSKQVTYKEPGTTHLPTSYTQIYKEICVGLFLLFEIEDASIQGMEKSSSFLVGGKSWVLW